MQVTDRKYFEDNLRIVGIGSNLIPITYTGLADV